MAWTKMQVERDNTPLPLDANLKPLACAVISKAIDDLSTVRTGKWQNDAPAQSAKEFLCEFNPDLEFWCSLAGLNTYAVIDAANKLIRTSKVPLLIAKVVQMGASA